MDLRTLSLIFSLLLVPSFSHAQSPDAEAMEDSGLVEVVYPVEISRPYRERRPKNQVTLQVDYENYMPANYFSPSVPEPNPNAYKSIFGETSIPMVNFALGWKHNLSLLGIELAAFYGTGAIQDNRIGDKVSLNLQKAGLKLAGYLDTLFKEPYVVPYAAAQFQIWNVFEESSTLVYERASAYGIGFQAGLLFQLNWLEPNSSLMALNESGLNNTYVDLFVQQYGDTVDSKDPYLASDLNWGVGLRLEY